MRALVVEDHTLFRQGLALLLTQRFEGVEVLQAESLAAALPFLAGSAALDLVLLDLDLEDGQGSAVVRIVRDRGYLGPLAVLADDLGSQEVAEVVRCGASGYIHKTSRTEVVEAAIRTLLRGQMYLPSQTALPSGDLDGASSERVRRRAQIIADLDLSERQVQVLALLAQGCTNKDIARRLDLLESTVKTHSLALFRKLGVSKRADAVLAAARLGLTFED